MIDWKYQTRWKIWCFCDQTGLMDWNDKVTNRKICFLCVFQVALASTLKFVVTWIWSTTLIWCALNVYTDIILHRRESIHSVGITSWLHWVHTQYLWNNIYRYSIRAKHNACFCILQYSSVSWFSCLLFKCIARFMWHYC